MIPQPAEISFSIGDLIHRAAGGVNTQLPDDQAEYIRKTIESRTPGLLTDGLTVSVNEELPDEGYHLEAVGKRAVLQGGDLAGVYYGIETLAKLDPAVMDDGIIVDDSPAFEWRGLLLDTSRHFIPIESIRLVLDCMARLKMNRFHWHINDDQGWRLELKGFPELTEIGSRTETETSRQGFYSQEDVAGIIQYAGERCITVVPEIEVPGHSLAAILTYPHLCCTGSPVRNKGHQKDLYCAGSEEVMTFFQLVFDEVCDLFPSAWIHIGGDEAPKERWDACARCNARMTDEGLRDSNELQAWLIGKCAEYLKTKGRTAIGWDEIADSRIYPGMITQWWRGRTHGSKPVEQAELQGGKVIASPNSWCYLSFPIDPNDNFAIERTSDLQQVYSAEYVPEGIKKGTVIGAECAIWTEFIDHKTMFDFLFPRVLACAELMWSYPAERDFGEFNNRVKAMEVFWNKQGINYGQSQRTQ